MEVRSKNCVDHDKQAEGRAKRLDQLMALAGEGLDPPLVLIDVAWDAKPPAFSTLGDSTPSGRLDRWSA
jgi:hypothetical protein